MYTYGSPRVGNVRFAAQFNECVPDSWRVGNSSDLVTSVRACMRVRVCAAMGALVWGLAGARQLLFRRCVRAALAGAAGAPPLP
jgi:hypothetical protein